MDSDVMKSILAVADTGSFSKAGTQLCVSQSAVSKRIKQLEEVLDISLLDRTGPLLALTPAGKLVAKKAKLILSLQQELLEEIKILKQNVLLSLCCTPSFGISFLPRITSCFMTRHPHINNINISYEMPNKILEDINKGSYQVAVIEHCCALEAPEKNTIQLQDDNMLLIGSPGLGLPLEKAPVDAILHHTIYTSSEGCFCRELLDRALACSDKKFSSFNKSLIYKDLNLIIKAVLDGEGIAYLSRGCVADYLYDGRLVASPVEGLESTFHRSMVIADMYTTVPDVEKLVKIIIEIAGAKDAETN